ncbi:VOC family protein [Undibacterium sp. JH2W]|uniref:VOC family protein n=1 Tax=Undibacterium sp. JH2W TaxID=3413037 RepID=UPI003BF1B7DA
MIGYITLGTNDIGRAAAFYDALLADVGARRQIDLEDFITWGASPKHPALSIVKPYNGEAATPGNGNMVALVMKTREQVQAVHKKALELGGKDEGAPGPRGDSGFYAAYFRDLDGHKLNAFCMGG